MVTVFLDGLGALAGNAFPPTGSITGPNPSPLAIPVQAEWLNTPAPAAGAVYPEPGAVAGVYQVAIQTPSVVYQQQILLHLSVGGLMVGPWDPIAWGPPGMYVCVGL